MMTVEEKPDVTYKDVGGSKEQIEKLREVVELPLLHVLYNFLHSLTLLA
jgi:26S proteasome regulatory subunit T1